MSKKALVTGISGQDGAYLAQHLLRNGYAVYGAMRRNASYSFARLVELGIQDDVIPITLDLLESSNLTKGIEKTKPDEVYNLAAQSFVAASFDQPIFTGDVDALGVTRLLEAIRAVNPGIKFYQASTSEMFGKVREVPQTETTPFHPRSPYGVAKLYGHWISINYRESYGMNTSSGILFNHESPLRGREFVTRKITASLARIRHGHQTELQLGNMDARRDWGFAGDYVQGMHLMLQQPHGDEYVLATGEEHSVEEFVTIAAETMGFSLDWQGEGVTRLAVDRATGKPLVRSVEEFYRPAEVDLLLGDATKAREKLGWVPKTTFRELVTMMAVADLRKAAQSPHFA
jgi:GDPmannose 4,6-dehydratase